MKSVIRKFCFLLSAAAAAVFVLIGVGTAFVPREITVYSKNDLTILSVFSVKRSEDEAVSAVSGDNGAGEENAQVRLFGIIPVEKIKTVEAQRKYVNVGGELIGIRLYTQGLMVVGIDEIATESGNVSPGRDCGICEGDIITQINDEPVFTTEAFSQVIAASEGRGVSITVSRDGQLYYYSLAPVYSPSEGKYRCGLWLRDSTAGIGTMTFTDPVTGMFAALGHAICDSETEAVLPVGGGDILKAEISGVTVGTKGTTGQIKGSFTSDIIGKLYANNDFGVYGTVSGEVSREGTLYPVAGAAEIQTGYAQIISTVDSGEPELYDIEIEKITYNGGNEMRTMTLKVTDEELLRKTGGIIQGMSGSPIIQNDMLVGAVTHVFLNDPSRGYGVFAQTMLGVEESIYREINQ